jgi:hypothetical protein
VRGTDDEDAYNTPAARTVTRKKKDVDEQEKKAARRTYSVTTHKLIANIDKTIAAAEPLTCT